MGMLTLNSSLEVGQCCSLVSVLSVWSSAKFMLGIYNIKLACLYKNLFYVWFFFV
jgi:hypothetical protein